MRTALASLAPALLAIAFLPAVLRAQDSPPAQARRFSLELMGARSTNSPIFEQTAAAPLSIPTTITTRLALDDASLGAARVGYRIAGGWMLFVDAGRGSTSFTFAQAVAHGGPPTLTTGRTGDATRTLFALGVGHRTELAGLPLSVEPELGLAVHRLTVGHPGVQCLPEPPTLGGTPSCVPSEQWEQVYSVPSIDAGLSLGYLVAQRIAVELRGQYAIGRANTEKGFPVDQIPQYDPAIATKSTTVRSTQLSVGLRITP